MKRKQPDGSVVIVSVSGAPIRVRTNRPFRPQWFTIDTFVESPPGTAIVQARLRLKSGHFETYQYGWQINFPPPFGAEMPAPFAFLVNASIQRIGLNNMNSWTGGYAFNYYLRRNWNCWKIG